jgi:hypothetical protein
MFSLREIENFRGRIRAGAGKAGTEPPLRR